MKGYYAYIRVSTVRQGEHSSSLAEQRSAIEAFASRQQLHIEKWFEERETAAKQGRPTFTAMLKELRRRRGAGLIVHKIDRSARNLRDWTSIVDLIDEGIEVHFAHDGVDLHTRGGRLTADIQAVIAADYVRGLREEVIKGIRGRLKQGIWPFPAPIGYCNRGGGRPKTIDPKVGPLVRSAFAMYATGTHTIESLRHEMARRGLRRGGRALGVNATASMLRNPFYMGILRVQRTGALYPGVHDPLVPKDTFERVQAVMDGRLYKGDKSQQFLFARRIRCKECEKALTGERQKGHVYYRCHTRTCRGTSLNQRVVISALAIIAGELEFDDEEIRDLRDLAAEAAGQAQIDRQTYLGERRMLLAQCEDRVRRLTDAFVDGDVEKEVYQVRQSQLLMERQGLRDAIADPPQDDFLETLTEKFELLKRNKYALFSTNIAFQQEVVDLLTSNLFAEGKNPLFKLHFAFSEVLKTRISMTGGPLNVQVRTDGLVYVDHSMSTSPKNASRLGITGIQAILSVWREIVWKGRGTSVRSLSGDNAPSRTSSEP